MGSIRVLLADDHAVLRDGLRALFGSIPGFEVVGEASTGEEAVAKGAELRPDVILMDIQMPGIGGIEATRRVVEACEDVGVVVVTMFEDDESVFAAMRAGARGYVLKSADASEVLRVVRGVSEGDVHFGPSMAGRLKGYFSGEKPAVLGQPFPELTAREREILDLIASGLSNTQISRKLFLSPSTVRNHITNVFAKLRVASRAQAIIRARDAGLGGDEQR